MIKQSQSPYGYKNLLVFKEAEELQLSCTELTGVFPKTKTLIALADQGFARLANGRIVKKEQE